MGGEGFDKTAAAGFEVVKDEDPALGFQKFFGKMRAEKSCPASNQNCGQGVGLFECGDRTFGHGQSLF